METLEKPLDSKVKVLKEEACEITFSVELPKTEVDRETEAAYQSIQTRASLPGFRVGKAPIELVRRNFADKARQAVMENLVGRAVGQLLKDRKLQTVDTPKIEKIDFDFGKPLVFQLKVEKDPDIKAKGYKGIKVNRPSTDVTDAMVEDTLKDLRERNASLAASEAKKVEKNHFVVVDFEGKIDGKAFSGGSAKDYLMDMNAPQTIAGFSDGILGMAPGETKSVTVTFPADYTHKEYAGKKAAFDVTVKDIKEKKLPTLDDDFAKDLGLEGIEPLKTRIRENLAKEQSARADRETEEQLHQALLEENVFSVPPTLVEERTRALTQRALANLIRQGLVKEGDAQAAQTLLEKSKPQAEKDVRLSYLLKSIAAQEKLDATEADILELKNKALAENKDKTADVEKYFQEHNYSILASLTEGKVLEFLKNTAKIKTAKG
jgi:trigger factor